MKPTTMLQDLLFFAALVAVAAAVFGLLYLAEQVSTNGVG